MVAHYKNEGFLINAWTVNKITSLQKVVALGIDGIITDYPNRLKDLVQ